MLIGALGEDGELRLLELRHAPALHDLVVANIDRLYWMPREYTLEVAAERIRQGLDRLREGTGLHAGIWYRGKLVGNVGLFHVEERTRTGELGYWLDAGAEGKGLITRACKVLLRYAFAELELRRVEIKCAASNVRSRAVPERLGFTLDGTMRKAEPVGDRWEDLFIYGLLADEWTAR